MIDMRTEASCYVGMARASLNSYTRLAPPWIGPSQKDTKGLSPEWLLPPLNCTVGWLTKGMLRWNGTYLPPNFPSGGSQKAMLRSKGSLRP